MSGNVFVVFLSFLKLKAKVRTLFNIKRREKKIEKERKKEKKKARKKKKTNAI